MKRLLLLILVGSSMTQLSAQQQAGKVIYERSMQINTVATSAQNIVQSQPIDSFELLFYRRQSLWKAGATKDILYTNFDTKRNVELRHLFNKDFIVEDSIQPFKWKMTGETKSILHYQCKKAIAIQQRTFMTLNKGNGQRSDVRDSVIIIAWVAMDIPVAAGPAEYQGQLPGLILEIDYNKGQQTYKAVSITDKTDITAIKEPSGTKRYTPQQFDKERRLILEQMRQNSIERTQTSPFIN